MSTALATNYAPFSEMPRLDVALRRFSTVGLTELNDEAQLLTRKDRKYIIRSTDLQTLLTAVPASTRVLETKPGRWSRYISTYLDTPQLDAYHLAARRRPGRFKVRLRRYIDSGLDVAEVKTKDRRGQTVKHRETILGTPSPVHLRHFAKQFEPCMPYVDALQPTLINSYRRATLLLSNGAGRVTIDLDYLADDWFGNHAELTDMCIIETKSSGRPSPFDRLLWQAGVRPVKFSKYSTTMAAMHPELPSNRWQRVLRRYALTVTTGPPNHGSANRQGPQLAPSPAP
jgi:hypothetical protein